MNRSMRIGRSVIRRSPFRRNVHGTLGLKRAMKRTFRDLTLTRGHPILRKCTMT